jgi:hypothetical protein
MIRVTKAVGGEAPMVQIYAVAAAEVREALQAVQERTGAHEEQIEPIGVLTATTIAALGLKPGEICVL